ncbi:transcriptional regulator domain-containing protein [Celeribacter indicus]
MAWEWLRRNDDYDADFEAAASARGDLDPLTEQIRQRWGLRFPGRSYAAASRSAGSLASAGGYQCRRACRHRGGVR